MHPFYLLHKSPLPFAIKGSSVSFSPRVWQPVKPCVIGSLSVKYPYIPLCQESILSAINLKLLAVSIGKLKSYVIPSPKTHNLQSFANNTSFTNNARVGPHLEFSIETCPQGKDNYKKKYQYKKYQDKGYD